MLGRAMVTKFQVADASSGQLPEYLDVQEGYYRGKDWNFLRTWNGDQTDRGLNFTAGPQVLQVTMDTYPLKAPTAAH
jgi:hypothetical protein